MGESIGAIKLCLSTDAVGVSRVFNLPCDCGYRACKCRGHVDRDGEPKNNHPHPASDSEGGGALLHQRVSRPRLMRVVRAVSPEILTRVRAKLCARGIVSARLEDRRARAEDKTKMKGFWEFCSKNLETPFPVLTTFFHLLDLFRSRARAGRPLDLRVVDHVDGGAR
jgi:transposase